MKDEMMFNYDSILSIEALYPVKECVKFLKEVGLAETRKEARLFLQWGKWEVTLETETFSDLECRWKFSASEASLSFHFLAQFLMKILQADRNLEVARCKKEVLEGIRNEEEVSFLSKGKIFPTHRA